MGSFEYLDITRLVLRQLDRTPQSWSYGLISNLQAEQPTVVRALRRSQRDGTRADRTSLLDADIYVSNGCHFGRIQITLGCRFSQTCHNRSVRVVATRYRNDGLHGQSNAA